MDRIIHHRGANLHQNNGLQRGARPADPPGQYLGNQGQQPENRLIDENHQHRFIPLPRRNALVQDRNFRPPLPPVREPSPVPEATPLRRQEAEGIAAIPERNRPHSRQVPDRALREVIRSAIDAGRLRQDISQTYIASRAFFGKPLADALHELRHLVSADQFDAAQFPELTDLLAGNRLFNALAQGLYDATHSPDTHTRFAKLLCLNDTLSALKIQSQELPYRYGAWKDSVVSRIQSIATYSHQIISGDAQVLQEDAEATDDLVRSVLVDAALHERSFSPPKNLTSLKLNLGKGAGAQLYHVQLLLTAVGQHRQTAGNRSDQFNAVLKAYFQGSLNDQALAKHLTELYRNINQSGSYTVVQKQAIQKRLDSVLRTIYSKITPSALATQKVHESFDRSNRQSSNTIEFLATHRHFTRAALLLADAKQHQTLNPQQATARLAFLDQVRNHAIAVLPPTQRPSLLSLFNAAQVHPSDATVLGASLESLKSDIQKSSLLSGEKYAYLELIANTLEDIDTHFTTNDLFDSRFSHNLRQWQDKFVHDLPQTHLEHLERTLSLVAVPKSQQLNFMINASKYLHPDTNDSIQAPYELFKQAGAGLMAAIDRSISG